MRIISKRKVSRNYRGVPVGPTDCGGQALDHTLVSNDCLGPCENGHPDDWEDGLGVVMVGGDGAVSADDASEKTLAYEDEDVELAVAVLTQDE